ncbi:unnamed protein product [Adineta ricciae]|uniref:Uncharacterized protein n=1 Tax=Adineta ricciae TaxID=249248 RepID=A0A813RYN6_ADIRI|nr:unnamed protein product [Adineta ricciae]CAF1217262.1 unnamed protein product [Adineta ricciae]
MQGDIRSYKDEIKAHFKDFLDLQEVETVPTELIFFEGLGLDKFLIIQEDKSWWDWNAFAVAMIGLTQVIGGAVLIAFGAVNIGSALVAEGLSDMIYATMAGLSGQFSWRDWAIQKSISFSVSLLSVGIGALSSIGSVAAKVGSVSRAALFFGVVKQVAQQFALTCLTNIITETVMEQVRNGIIPKIVKTIEETLLKGISSAVRAKVERLYSSDKTDGKIEEEYGKMKGHLVDALFGHQLLSREFESIRSQVVNALQNSYKAIAEGFSKSSSKYVKMIGAAAQVTLFIDKMYNAVKSFLNVTSVIATLNNIIESSAQTNNENVKKNNSNAKLVEARAEELMKHVKDCITKKLTALLDQILRAIINKTLRMVGTALAAGMQTMVSSATENKQQTKENKDSQVSVEGPSPKDCTQKDEDAEKKREDLQNNVKACKTQQEMYEDEAKDTTRGKNLADIHLLSNAKCRNIIVIDTETNEEKIIRPDGLRKVVAFFKTDAKIKYIPGTEYGQMGHYTTARGKESFVQKNGRNDCLLIAYHESLGSKVDETFIDKERIAFNQYTSQHLDLYVTYRTHLDATGQKLMIGGKVPLRSDEVVTPKKTVASDDTDTSKRPKLNSNEEEEKRDQTPRTSRSQEREKKEETPQVKKRRSSSERRGTFGGRYKERDRLAAEHDTPVTGETHEAEHVYPYGSVTDGLSRKSPAGRQLANESLAYYENRDAHRQHIGTGSSQGSVAYRRATRTALVEERSAGNAIQLNQLEYAHTSAFVKNRNHISLEISDDSFSSMLMSARNRPIPYRDNNNSSPPIVQLTDTDIKESLLARWTARHARYPSSSEAQGIIWKFYEAYKLRSPDGARTFSPNISWNSTPPQTDKNKFCGTEK